jgi:carboxypeptidase family protein
MTTQRFDPSRSTISCAAILSLMMFAGSVISGQEAAGIIGQVTDESGAVLPGVTVTVTGPALQVPSVVAVSDQRGEYRLIPLPIGTYTVEYTLPGFQTVRREGIRLTVGFTAKVDIGLKLGSVAETITVSGATPVVDVRSTTATTQLTRETIELLPSSRNGIVSILAQAPGVRTLRDIGGSSLNTVPTYRVFGQTAEPYATLEGVETSSLQAAGGQANYWDYSAIDEASVRTLGNSAEVPTRGVNLTALVKSGGNDFHGGGQVNATSDRFQSNNIDSALAAQGIKSGDTLVQRRNYQGDLGGRIVRDTLWFYGAARRVTNYYNPLNSFKPDGSRALYDGYAWYQTEKLSYQLSSSNRVVGFYQYNHKYDPGTLSQFHPWDYRGGITTFDSEGKIEWQKTYGSSLVTSLQYGHWQYNSIYWNRSAPGTPSTTDLVTQQETGPQTTVGQRPYNPRYHFKGSASWYRPDLFHGNHEFKFGFDYEDSEFGRRYPPLSPGLTESGAYAAASAFPNYQLIFTNGTPFEVVVFNNPANAWVVSHYFGLYVQDGWALGRRLSLNLGLRYAHDNGFVPNSCRDPASPPGDVAFPAACYPMQQFNIWNTVAPRLHASYDVSGNGKTVVKGGWGRYDHRRQHVPELDAADPQVRTQVTYRWHAPIGSQVYLPGQVNLDPNGPDFVSQSGGSNTVANPNEKEPKADEFFVSLERELMPNFAVRVSGVYARTEVYRILNLLRPYTAYSVPVTNADPNVPGTFITYYEYPTSLAGRAFELFTLTNDYNATETFKSLDVAASKRLSNKWELMASYSATKPDYPIMPALTVDDSSSNITSGPVNPNAEINTSDRAWEWTGKVSGVYTLPYDVLVSAQFEHRGGYPWARQVLFRGGKTIPSITLNVEPFGTRRDPNTNQLDARFERSFKLTRGHKVSARVSIFNALNSNAILDLVRQSGPTFMLPRSIMPARIVEFSGSYTF